MIDAIPKEYPEYVKRILRDDILLREKGNNIRIAYELSEEIHRDQTRKGLDSLDYITHPLRVYDLVNRCVNKGGKKRDLMLCTALLHDAIEDYEPQCYDVSPIRSKEDVRNEIIEKIHSKFPDKKFADELLVMLGEVTDPLEFKDAEGNKISKKDWQVEHIKHISVPARVVKICDQTANLISDIEEVPNWNYERIKDYRDKATAVVDSATDGIIADEEKHHRSMVYASRMYHVVATFCETLLRDMKEDNKAIPPDYSHATISMDLVGKMVDKIIDRGSRYSQDKPRQR